ncbi:cytochrome P450 [Collybia nuda]|uniref:Cytochrome P450 n=1 Tax=Collybia nuda TaxID=64659 RepID=A0A9P6CNY7_9AGAR|nr:cytochrome P450 [Collybia nuda]
MYSILTSSSVTSMYPKFPPGPAFLFRNLPSICLPFGGTYVLHHFTQICLGIQLPIWAFILPLALSLPVTLTLKVLYAEYVNRKAAAIRGAVLPPQVYDKWPGGISLLMKSVRNHKEGYPGDPLLECSKLYGNTFNIKILFESRIFTTEPEYIKAILATQFEYFEKGRPFMKALLEQIQILYFTGPEFYLQMKSFLGTGVFNSDGEMWKFHRAITRPFFNKDRVTHFDIFERHAQDAIKQLKVRLSEGYPVDIQDLASRFTMDSATEFLFAKDVQSLDAGIPYPHYSPLSHSSTAAAHPANIFSKAFDKVQRSISLRSRFGAFWPLAEFWTDKVQLQMATIHNFINPILLEALQRKRALDMDKTTNTNVSLNREVEEGESLLDHLMKCTEDETVLRDETLNILLAGRDTTTNTITFSVYMLAKHPQVLQRLREEILSKLGNSERPTYDNMKDMKYLRAVINETLRLYPPVPFNIRTTNKPTLWSPKNGGKPFYIPPNTRVPYSVFLMHRRTDLWGPDASEYDPDRFIDERLHKYLTPNPFIFLPFNAGPRICLGQQFAYHETSFFLIRLLQSFKSITAVPEAQPPETRPPAHWSTAGGTKADTIWPKSYLTMSVLGGCWVRLEEDLGSSDTEFVHLI